MHCFAIKLHFSNPSPYWGLILQLTLSEKKKGTPLTGHQSITELTQRDRQAINAPS